MIVHEYEEGKFREFRGGKVTKTCDTAMLQFPDGRQIEQKVDPYTIEVVVSAAGLKVMSDEELADMALYRPVAFRVPEGKRISGPVQWIKDGGKVLEVYPVEDIPPPPPPPPPLTLEERLENAGLSLEELKQALKD